MRTPKRILERRRSVRLDESLPFRIGHEDYEAEVRTLNISGHGALCLIDKDIPLMTRLKIGLTVPLAGSSARAKARTIRLKGVVVRRQEDKATGKFYVAVYFSDMSPDDQRLLQDYIDNRLKS